MVFSLYIFYSWYPFLDYVTIKNQGYNFFHFYFTKIPSYPKGFSLAPCRRLVFAIQLSIQASKLIIFSQNQTSKTSKKNSPAFTGESFLSFNLQINLLKTHSSSFRGGREGSLNQSFQGRSGGVVQIIFSGAVGRGRSNNLFRGGREGSLN